MTTKGKIFIVFFTLLIGKFGTTETAYNPLLTYITRIRNFIFLPNIYGNYTFNNFKTTNEYIDVHFSINIPSNMRKKDIDAIVIFKRCDPEGINCEYFETWKLPLCRILNEKNQIWSSLIRDVHPPLTCPLKEYYHIRNATLELGPLILLYPKSTDYLWKTLIKFQFNNFFLGGIKFDTSHFGYRKRINKNKLIG